MADLTTANDLRRYAEWMEQHPEIAIPCTAISTYNVKADKALMLLRAGAKLDLLRHNDEIAYIRQSFGGLTVQHVVDKSEVMEPAIVDGKVAWTVRPEFSFAEVR